MKKFTIDKSMHTVLESRGYSSSALAETVIETSLKGLAMYPISRTTTESDKDGAPFVFLPGNWGVG